MMSNAQSREISLNFGPDLIRQALDIYLGHAYLGPPNEQATALLPPEGNFDPEQWLFQEMVERDPPDADFATLRSAAVRLGNTFYPNMKVRLSRPPHGEVFLFSVDAHDAVLQAPEGSSDHAMLEELKAHNAKLAAAITADWDAAGVPTERNYLRAKIFQAKQAKKEAEDSAAEGAAS